MGSSGKVSLENICDILGDKMPEMPHNRVGRLRLVHALQERFGVNFRNIPGVRDTIAEFDKNIEAENLAKMNRG